VNVSGNPSRYILIGTPALFDQFLEAGARELQPGDVAGPPTPQEIERLREASPRFGHHSVPGLAAAPEQRRLTSAEQGTLDHRP
jgi:hypothetical protein